MEVLAIEIQKNGLQMVELHWDAVIQANTTARMNSAGQASVCQVICLEQFKQQAETINTLRFNA